MTLLLVTKEHGPITMITFVRLLSLRLSVVHRLADIFARLSDMQYIHVTKIKAILNDLEHFTSQVKKQMEQFAQQ